MNEAPEVGELFSELLRQEAKCERRCRSWELRKTSTGAIAHCGICSRVLGFRAIERVAVGYLRKHEDLLRRALRDMPNNEFAELRAALGLPLDGGSSMVH